VVELADVDVDDAPPADLMHGVSLAMAPDGRFDGPIRAHGPVTQRCGRIGTFGQYAIPVPGATLMVR
jgi:hypothetical protein